MKTLTQFIENTKMKDEEELLFEGKKSVGAIKSIALFLKRKVIIYSKRVKSESDTNKKIDMLSSQCSALASLLILNIAMEDEGEGLFSKGIIASGLFTETNDETTKEKELNL
jgi:hypothetical protein